jgi:hypothetical protein
MTPTASMASAPSATTIQDIFAARPSMFVSPDMLSPDLADVPYPAVGRVWPADT